MFANATLKVGISQRVVATLVACAVVLMSVGVYTTVQAADLSQVSDTLSDSAPGNDSNHTIEFTVPAGATGVGAGQTITVTFPAGFDLTGIDFNDVDLEINAVDQPLAAAANLGTWGATVSGQILTLTSGTDTIVPTDNVLIQIGTNAAGGADQINNHASTGSYRLVITAGTADSGRTMVAIVNTVLVEAIVETTFSFTITGVATSTVVNGETTTGSTSPTSINYGVIAAGSPEVLAQRLNVSTNANNGFVVTVESDGDLQSANGAIIDNFDEGSDVSDPIPWALPTPNVNQDNTWGHWGLTTTDGDLNANGGYYTTEFGASEFIAASTTPREVFHHDRPADGVTANIGSTTVAYKLAITPLQEAADDYNTTLTYIATPTF